MQRARIDLAFGRMAADPTRLFGGPEVPTSFYSGVQLG